MIQNIIYFEKCYLYIFKNTMFILLVFVECSINIKYIKLVKSIAQVFNILTEFMSAFCILFLENVDISAESLFCFVRFVHTF